MYAYNYMQRCVFADHSPQEGYETGPNSFQQSLTFFNSDFSLSYTGCHTKIGDSFLPKYLHIAGGRIG